MSELTENEAKLLKFIKAYMRQHGGLGPSYIDIMESLEVSRSTTQTLMKGLEKKGCVKWPFKRIRSIKVLK